MGATSVSSREVSVRAGRLPVAVQAGLDGLDQICTDLQFSIETSDLAMRRALEDFSQGATLEDGREYKPRAYLAIQLHSLALDEWRALRALREEYAATFGVAASSVLRTVLAGEEPGEHLLFAAERVGPRPHALAKALPRLTTGVGELDRDLHTFHPEVTKRLKAADRLERGDVTGDTFDLAKDLPATLQSYGRACVLAARKLTMLAG